jgi:hypothetical protein
MNKKALLVASAILLTAYYDSLVPNITLKNATPHAIELYAVKEPHTLTSFTSRLESIWDEDASEPTVTAIKLLTLNKGASLLLDHDTLAKWGLESKFIRKTFDRISIVIKNTGQSKSNFDIVRINKHLLVDLDKAIDGRITINHNASKKANNFYVTISYDSSTKPMTQLHEKSL